MRAHISRFASAAVFAAAVAISAAPAAAQDLASGAVHAAPAAAVTREVATWRINGGQRDGLPVEVSIGDRGGKIVASYRMHGESNAQPMMVTVLDTDLVLQAETDKGVLTLQLFEQNDAPAGRALSGRWTLGKLSGELRGVKK